MSQIRIISEELKEEIFQYSCEVLEDILSQIEFNPGNTELPIKRIRGLLVNELSSRYTSKINKDSPGIHPKKTLHDIAELTANNLGYQRMYRDKSSNEWKPFEDKILETEVANQHFMPIYWVKNQLISEY